MNKFKYLPHTIIFIVLIVKSIISQLNYLDCILFTLLGSYDILKDKLENKTDTKRLEEIESKINTLSIAAGFRK